MPGIIAADELRDQAERDIEQKLAAANESGLTLTVEGQTITFGVSTADYKTLMGDLAGMLDLDMVGAPDAPEKLQDKDEYIHTIPTRARARQFIREYRIQNKPKWAALYPPFPTP